MKLIIVFFISAMLILYVFTSTSCKSSTEPKKAEKEKIPKRFVIIDDTDLGVFLPSVYVIKDTKTNKEYILFKIDSEIMVIESEKKELIK